MHEMVPKITILHKWAHSSVIQIIDLGHNWMNDASIHLDKMKMLYSSGKHLFVGFKTIIFLYGRYWSILHPKWSLSDE